MKYLDFPDIDWFQILELTQLQSYFWPKQENMSKIPFDCTLCQSDKCELKCTARENQVTVQYPHICLTYCVLQRAVHSVRTRLSSRNNLMINPFLHCGVAWARPIAHVSSGYPFILLRLFIIGMTVLNTQHFLCTRNFLAHNLNTVENQLMSLDAYDYFAFFLDTCTCNRVFDHLIKCIKMFLT